MGEISKEYQTPISKTTEQGSASIQDLIRRLAEVEAAFQAALRGQIDVVLDPVDRAPIMLRQAQEALQRSERQLVQAEQIANLGSWTWDIHSNTISRSDELYRIFGFVPYETNLTFEDFLERIHPEDRSFVREKIVAALHDPQPFTFTHRIVRPDGQERTLLARGEAVLDQDGKAIRLIGTGQDITEQVHAEARLHSLVKELRAAEEEMRRQNEALLAAQQELLLERQRYQELFEFAPDGYLVTDASGAIRQANRAAENLLQVEAKQLARRRLVSFVEPSQRRIFKAMVAQLQVGEKVRGWETLLRPPDGQSIPVALIVDSVVDPEGRVSALRWLLHDISSLKRAEKKLRESEERYRLVVESVKDYAIYTLAPQGHITSWNPGAQAIQGYSADEVLGQHFSIFYPPEARQAGLPERAILQALETGRYVDEGWRLRKDGSRFWATIVLTALRDETSRLRGFAKVLRDFTQQKQAAEALRQSEERLRKVITGAPVILWAVDRQGIFTFQDGKALQSLGMAPGDSIGKSIYAKAESNPEIVEFVQRALAGEEVVSLNRSDSGELIFETRYSPMLDSQGEIVGVIGVSTDVTQRVRAEENLRKQSNIVRLLQEVAVAANQAASVEDAMQFALERICRFTGWENGHADLLPFDQSIGRESLSIWRPVDSDQAGPLASAQDSPPYRFGASFIDTVYKTGQPLWIADIDRHPEFLRLPAAVAGRLKMGLAFPILAGSNVVGVLEFYASKPQEPEASLLEAMALIGNQLGRVVERTRAEAALRQSEARFRTIFDHAAVGILLLDLNGQVMDCNPAARKMFGYLAEELKGMSIFDLSAPDQDDAEPAMFAEMAAGERNLYRLEKPYRRRDGRPVWGHLLVSMVRDSAHLPSFAIAMLEDITERKQLEAELEELKRRLMQGDENEQLHLSRELHDGPVQDLYGLSYHLSSFADQLPEDVDRRPIEKLQENLHRVINTLRTISGELRPPTLAPFGLEKAIRSHASAFQQEYPQLVVELDLDPDGQTLPEPVRLALFRIYQQALTNVVRHANARHVLVHFSLDEQRVNLAIQDDGIGFALPKRWIELARDGHLGLVGARERAESIAGQLKIESAPGKGTLLRVIVPRIEKDASAQV